MHLLDKLGVGFDRLAGAAIYLLDELGELASDVRRVAVQDWSVTNADLARVIENDDLGDEGLGRLWWVVLLVAADVTTTNFLDGNTLDVEADIVTRLAFSELFVMHFDGPDLSSHTGRRKGDNHSGLDGASLDTTDWYSANTTNLVDVLERKTERLVGRTGWGVNGIDGLKEGLAGDLGLGLLLPPFVPRAVCGWFDHVIAVEAGDRDEWDVLGIVADSLDEVGRLLDDFVVTIFGPLGCIHLVDGNDELSDAEGVGKQGMLSGLAIFGDTSLEFASTGSNDENGAVRLGGAGDHVLDEVAVTRSVNDGDIIPRSFELPESNVDCDTTFTLGLELVKHPGVLEGALAKFGGFL